MSAAAACSSQQAANARAARPAPRNAASATVPLAARPRPAALRSVRRPLAVTAAASSSSSVAVDLTAQLQVLQRACRTRKVDPDEVMATLAQVEAAHKQQSQVQGFPEALTGTWRLVFSSPSPIKAWQYIPVLEDAIIDADKGTVDLASVVGPSAKWGLDNVFKGRGTFRQDPATGTFAMDFGFTGAEAKWFNRWETMSEFVEKRKTYSFFLLTDELAAAQSSGGPKTLMFRVK